MPPGCFWDVMPIPRCALTARLLHSAVHDVRTRLGLSSVGSARVHATIHDYHRLHGKVNAKRNGRRRCARHLLFSADR